MATDVQVPALGESITEGTLAQWLKKPGEAVAADEPIASLETDKVSVEVPSPIAGVLTEQLVAEGDTVAVGAPIARIDENARPRRATAGARPRRLPRQIRPVRAKIRSSAAGACAGACSRPRPNIAGDDHITTLSPAVRRAVLEYHVDPTKIRGTGKDGRLTKDDVIAAAQAKTAAARMRRRRPPAAAGCARAAGEGARHSPASGAKSASR